MEERFAIQTGTESPSAWLGETARGERIVFDNHERALQWTRSHVPCTLTPLFAHRPSLRDGELVRLRAERDALAAALAERAALELGASSGAGGEALGERDGGQSTFPAA